MMENLTLYLTGLNYGEAIWADLNNENKPDLVTFGYTDAIADSAKTPKTIVYLNATTTTNAAPVAPASIMATQNSSTATLSWTMPANADDHTINADLTYNVRIGTTSGASDIMKANVYGPGEFKQTSTNIQSLADGTYYWSVQAVDNANVAGAWATEGTFTIGGSTSISSGQANNYNIIYPTIAKDFIYIEGTVSSVEIFAITGQMVIQQKANKINVSNLSSGSYIVKTKYTDGTSQMKTIIVAK